MARRYYKKRNSYKKKYKTKQEQEIDAITLIVILVVALSTVIYYKFIRGNEDSILLFLKVFVPIILIGGGFVYYYLRKNKKEKELVKLKNTPIFLQELEKNIKGFKPLRKYTKEDSYHIGLYGYLQNHYPDLEIEKTIDYSRPDIIIDNIAIEVKGPTNMSGLKTIPDKINKYIPTWEYLFIVLFDIKIGNDSVKSKQIYEEKKREILENTIDSKKDKVFFIEID